MRLNPDCIRDILLCVEEHTGHNRFASFVDVETTKELRDFLGDVPEAQDYQDELLKKYSSPELMYHLAYCIKDTLIESPDNSIGGTLLTINDLTPKGHQLLENIRHKTVFEKTKEIAKKLGIESLPAFRNISESVTSEMIKMYLTSN